MTNAEKFKEIFGFEPKVITTCIRQYDKEVCEKCSSVTVCATWLYCMQYEPPKTLIRPKGHWIPIYQGDEIINYRCSECEFGNTLGKGTFGMDFCPRCGSYNREAVEK